MGFCKISIALVSLMVLAVFHSSQAQNSPKDYLIAHNGARAQVGVGPMTRDNKVAAYTQNYVNKKADDCNLVHSNGPYGKNLVEASYGTTEAKDVNLWVKEKPMYDYNSNSCIGGKCGHYTRWFGTTQFTSDALGFSASETKMGFCKISIALVSLMVLVVFPSSQAQNSHRDYLIAHNAARAQVGVDPMTWDNKVAAYAQNYANQRARDCKLVHSNGPYGENIVEASYAITGSESVKLWVKEKPKYDYKSNSCIGGECGHYTQVVWRNSVHLGCARVSCRSGWWFVTCNYDPPGNWIGERPY
ncbi:unnamed protein product [Ilex paraguariensis]|uniref:SCP domain-containing protein n=1 Tax=Ilex paraguariensis TaxID=185542 RepID=A0ABC8RJ48_9AQUA